jgi:hypothetical protein
VAYPPVAPVATFPILPLGPVVLATGAAGSLPASAREVEDGPDESDHANNGHEYKYALDPMHHRASAGPRASMLARSARSPSATPRARLWRSWRRTTRSERPRSPGRCRALSKWRRETAPAREGLIGVM